MKYDPETVHSFIIFFFLHRWSVIQKKIHDKLWKIILMVSRSDPNNWNVLPPVSRWYKCSDSFRSLLHLDRLSRYTWNRKGQSREETCLFGEGISPLYPRLKQQQRPPARTADCFRLTDGNDASFTGAGERAHIIFGQCLSKLGE